MADKLHTLALDLAAKLGYLTTPDAATVLRDIRDEPDPVRALSLRGLVTTEQGDQIRDRLQEFLQGRETVPGLPARLPAPFGEYMLLEVIGQGGMGVVYRARQESLKRDVAIKFLLGAGVEDVARFRREAEISAKLSHPNIGAIYEVGDREEGAFIAMQLVRGRTLSRVPRDPKIIVPLMRDAAHAVHYAHEQGIIHRDLKPDNIMVEGSRVFVMDFGLAREVAAGGRHEGIVGTPVFMPPEQTVGEPSDARSDVYSLGATLYGLLTGRPPFMGKTLTEVLVNVRDQAAPVPSAVDPRIDRELDAIVLKCLEKNPRDRYRSARALAEDLTRYLQGEIVRAVPSSARYLLRKALRKRRALLLTAASGIAAVALTAGLLVPKWLAQRAESRRKSSALVAAEEDRRKKERESIEREAALRELGALWSGVVLAKQGFHNEANDPRRVCAEIEQAVGKVSDYILRHPGHPQGYYVRARGRLYLDELEQAEEDLRKALELEPRFAPGEALLGRVMVERFLRLSSIDGRWDRESGREFLEEGRARLKDAWEGGAERISIEKWGLPRTPEDDVAEVLAQALSASYYESDKAKTLAILKEAMSRRDSEEYWALLARGGASADAKIEMLSKAIRLCPHFARALHDRALAYDEKKQHVLALADLEAVLRIRPRNVHALNARGNQHVALKRPDRAFADYSEAIRIRPDYAAAHHNRGNVRCELGQWDEALVDYAEAIRLNPHDFSPYFHRARVYYRGRQFDLAIADLDEAIRLKPDHAEAWYHRGMARFLKGDTAGAIRDFDEAIRRSPGVAVWHLRRGEAHHARMEFREAAADYEKALEIAPPDWRDRKAVEQSLRAARENRR